jgi:hypothetical protein
MLLYESKLSALEDRHRVLIQHINGKWSDLGLYA